MRDIGNSFGEMPPQCLPSHSPHWLCEAFMSCGVMVTGEWSLEYPDDEYGRLPGTDDTSGQIWFDSY